MADKAYTPYMAVRFAKGAMTVLIAGALVCFAPSQVGVEARNSADDAWFRNDWPAAITGYRQVVRNDPKDGEAWYRLGFAYNGNGDREQAIGCYERAIGLKFGVLSTRYNLACTYAQLGQHDRAIETLERAIEAGFSMTSQLETDPELSPIKTHPRYAELVQRTVEPVASLPEGRRADPFRGYWNVAGSSGEVGTLTANVSTKGFVRQLELFVDGVRTMHAVLYYSGVEKEWRVRGAASDGTAYTGRVDFAGRSMTLSGRREGEETRATIDLDAGRMSTEAREGGSWRAEEAYALDFDPWPSGGR